MYRTSTKYERLWELIQPTDEERANAGTIAIPESGILYRSAFGKNKDFATPWSICPKAATRWTKEGFISDCKKHRVEFIDPASQQKTTAELAAGEMVEELSAIRKVIECAEFREDCERIDKLLKKAKGLKS